MTRNIAEENRNRREEMMERIKACGQFLVQRNTLQIYM